MKKLLWISGSIAAAVAPIATIVAFKVQPKKSNSQDSRLSTTRTTPQKDTAPSGVSRVTAKKPTISSRPSSIHVALTNDELSRLGLPTRNVITCCCPNCVRYLTVAEDYNSRADSAIQDALAILQTQGS